MGFKEKSLPKVLLVLFIFTFFSNVLFSYCSAHSFTQIKRTQGLTEGQNSLTNVEAQDYEDILNINSWRYESKKENGDKYVSNTTMEHSYNKKLLEVKNCNKFKINNVPLLKNRYNYSNIKKHYFIKPFTLSSYNLTNQFLKDEPAQSSINIKFINWNLSRQKGNHNEKDSYNPETDLANVMLGDDPQVLNDHLFLRGSRNMMNNNQHFQKFVLPPLNTLLQNDKLQLNPEAYDHNKNLDNQNQRVNEPDLKLIVRPSSSEYLLPISDLQENPDPKYDPRPTDLNPRKLKALLGRRYDHRYMSAFRPQDSISHPNGTIYFGFRQNSRGLPSGNRITMYKIMNMNFKMAGMRRKIRLRVSRRIKRKLFKYLKAYTSCPVLYRWKNIGKRFWPNWVLEGQCYGSGNESPHIFPTNSIHHLHTSVNNQENDYINYNSDNNVDRNGEDTNHNNVIDLKLSDGAKFIMANNERADGGNDKVRSCSIPPGMICRPSTTINLTILRWYCQNWESKSYCSWIFVQYPIIESCKCSC
ncbi:uncharacterized protein LOC135922317 [Gordionus sp. m RMFG-2023]|uniref:uncharacterized protein LOC135922317 n=1 Tax=Gordionus sp. m RMFG-2023 TaxID=3053472 RepID=UPI0031FE3D05